MISGGHSHGHGDGHSHGHDHHGHDHHGHGHLEEKLISSRSGALLEDDVIGKVYSTRFNQMNDLSRLNDIINYLKFKDIKEITVEKNTSTSSAEIEKTHRTLSKSSTPRTKAKEIF